jgi:hypothetical protein
MGNAASNLGLAFVGAVEGFSYEPVVVGRVEDRVDFRFTRDECGRQGLGDRALRNWRLRWYPFAMDKFDRIFQLRAILASRRTPIALTAPRFVSTADYAKILTVDSGACLGAALRCR